MIDFKARLACDVTPADPEVARRSITELKERGLCPLPDDYLEFLAVVGSLESEEVHLVRSPGDYEYSDEYVGIEMLYTAKGGGRDDILTENETAAVKWMLNIGDNDSNLFIMSLQEDDFGYIYYLAHEAFYDEEAGEEFEFGDPKASVAARRHLVATSFTDFLNLMRCDDVFVPVQASDPSVYGEQMAWASQDGVRPRHPGWDDD